MFETPFKAVQGGKNRDGICFCAHDDSVHLCTVSLTFSIIKSFSKVAWNAPLQRSHGWKFNGQPCKKESLGRMHYLVLYDIWFDYMKTGFYINYSLAFFPTNNLSFQVSNKSHIIILKHWFILVYYDLEKKNFSTSMQFSHFLFSTGVDNITRKLLYKVKSQGQPRLKAESM